MTDYQKRKAIAFRISILCLYTVSLLFLVFVGIGNTANKVLIKDTFWLKIEVTNIITNSISNPVVINSVAPWISLHDFYQVGLWSFCGGYEGRGIVYCSQPKTLYWFNPVEIIIGELLAGGSMTLPQNLADNLDRARVASRWMSICYLAGTSLTFLCIFFLPMGFSPVSSWAHNPKSTFSRQLALSILSFLALLFTIGFSTIGTVVFIFFRNHFRDSHDLSVTAQLGTQMFVFVLISAGLSLAGFLLHISTWLLFCCCCERAKTGGFSP